MGSSKLPFDRKYGGGLFNPANPSWKAFYPQNGGDSLAGGRLPDKKRKRATAASGPPLWGGGGGEGGLVESPVQNTDVF